MKKLFLLFLYLFRFRLIHIFAIYISICTPYHLNAKTHRVHALIAVDTNSNLKQSVKKDAEKIEKLLAILSLENIHVNKKLLSGDKLTISNLKRWIAKTSVSDDDVLFFYFSGHGCRSEEWKSPWPFMAFQQGEELISTRTVKTALLKKKARLTFIITDCCNGYLVPKSFSATEFFSRTKTQPLEKELALSMKKLFFDTKGLICLTASVPGKEALGFVEHGGLLTNILFATLIDLHKSPNVNWHMIFEEIKLTCFPFQQVPYYEIRDAK